MTDVPLKTASVDAAVFCLSLMGVDYGDAILEARRVLRDGGRLFIAEVRSRFADAGATTTTAAAAATAAGARETRVQADGSTGSSVLRSFLSALKAVGFLLVPRECDLKSNTHFFTLSCTLRKARGAQPSQIRWPRLKACTYKKR